MINIYYGRESHNKENFIYEEIAKENKDTIVLVPDQYTLEAERQALKYTGKKALVNILVTNFSRLGTKLENSVRQSDFTVITKTGRQMLLSNIMRNHKDELNTFGGLAEKIDFVSDIDDFIAMAKQYDLTPEYFKVQVDLIQGESQLKDKLKDLYLIYSEYEKSIEGKYIDLEYNMDNYCKLIEQDKSLKSKTVWVYGFDVFTPKTFNMISSLANNCENINVVLNYDGDENTTSLFELTKWIIDDLKEVGKQWNLPVTVSEIDDSYEQDGVAPGIKATEKYLFSRVKPQGQDGSGVTLMECANGYNEIESAAGFINYLIREKGYSFSDIVVISNASEERESTIERVFSEYDIDVFQDKKRKIINSPFVIFMISLMEASAKGMRTPDVLNIVKSGFAGVTREEAEELENYGIAFKIRGNMWKNEAPDVENYGVSYDKDRIEGIRKTVIDPIEKLKRLVGESSTNGELLLNYYKLLVEDYKVDETLVKLAKQQFDNGDVDGSVETKQLWEKSMDMLEQINELVGEEPANIDNIIDMLSIGFSSQEIGVVPPISDTVLIGTSQRTRVARAKAVIVLGANEGVFPSGASESVLFSDEELLSLGDSNEMTCQIKTMQNKRKIMELEETLGIYRTLALPKEHLWVSYCRNDSEGREMQASEIVADLASLLDVEIEIDPISKGEVEKYIGGEINTLRHLSVNLQRKKRGLEIDPKWEYISSWYEGNCNTAEYENVKQVLSSDRRVDHLPPQIVRDLYSRAGEGDDFGNDVYSLSPSRIEKFGRCPFAYFVNFGLKPKERRIYEAGGREIGDVFHKVLLEVSKKISEEGPNHWSTIEREDSNKLVSDLTAEVAAEYGSGLFGKDNEEKYKTRRAIDQLQTAAWYLIVQMRQGNIVDSAFEQRFGRFARDGEERLLPPIEKEFAEGKVYIEGIIDRIDYLTEDRKVKIIDYKTGYEKFDKAEAEAGYRLQLMIYLKAAQCDRYDPAGVFYFLLGDKKVNVLPGKNEDVEEKIDQEMMKMYKLDGIMVDDEHVIHAIDKECNSFSKIIPIRVTKNGIVGTTKDKLLTNEEFANLQAAIDSKLDELCQGLLKGRIDISPMKANSSTSCDYCMYRSICNFDEQMPGCDYRKI